MSTRKRASLCAAACIAVFCAGALHVLGEGVVPGAGLARRADSTYPLRTAAVVRDSLESMVRFLSIDPATSLPRSRFVLREGEIGIVADSLAARFERYLGSVADRITFGFTESHYSNDSTFSAENIVARLAGTGETPGVFIVAAHYDAIALQTSGFRSNWETWPAPGANDNATGVAAVMELARSLSQRHLPYDVLFVLFSGEELGKLGSEDFAARFESLYGDEILAVINLDMLGYRPRAGGVQDEPAILTNYLSGWLADLICGTATSVEPPLALRVVKPASSSYDHGPFWERRISAVTLTEALTEEGSIAYPQWHTLGDTISAAIDFAQVETITDAVLDFLLDLAVVPAEIAVLPSDVMLMNGPLVTGRRLFETGDSLGVLVRVRNTGCLDAPALAALHLTVSIENARGKETIFSGDVEPPGPLRTSDTIVRLKLGNDFVGENIIRATVRIAGMEDGADNNTAEEHFGVEGGVTSLLDHGFRPNPVSSSLRSASFCVNLAREVDFMIEVYNLEGERVAEGHAGSRWGRALSAGMNCLSCGTLFPAVDDLASGIYLYRLRIFEASGASAQVKGRFAVEN